MTARRGAGEARRPRPSRRLTEGNGQFRGAGIRLHRPSFRVRRIRIPFTAGGLHMRCAMPTICTSERVPIRPRVERREERHYLSILACVRPDQILSVLPGLWQDVAQHLATRGANPSGPAFVRHVITRSDACVELEAAVPVVDSVPGDRRVRTGVLPAGNYAVVRYAGDWRQLLDAQNALIDWGEEGGIEWDSWPMEEGTAWGGRIATFPTHRQRGPHSTEGGGEIECRIRAAAASRPRSSHRFALPSNYHQGSSQNDSAVGQLRHGSRR